jgi:hypothetical protein
MFTEAKLIGGAVSFLLLAAAIGWGATVIHHRGYVSGQDERTAYYAPLMKAANDAKDAANARAEKAEKAAGMINVQSEKDHAQFIQTLAQRESAAAARIADILRHRAAADRAARGGQLPGVAGAANQLGGTAPGDNGDSRFSASISAVGARCEHDAAAVSEFQRWYAEQRLNAAAVNP